MLGVVKHTIEGDTLCHDWSSGYAGYSRQETQEKIDRWSAGPTTCAHFRGTNGNRCAGCSLEVSSPIHLGYTVDAPPVPAPEATPELPADGQTPTWPKGFGWNGQLVYWHEDDLGQGGWRGFCDTLWYPVNRVRGEDGVWNLRIRHQAKNHQWREFDLPCELIGAQQGLTAVLAAHEVFVYGKVGLAMTKELLRKYTLELQQLSVEQVTYSKFGWADDFGSFIIGNQRITSNNTATILPGEQIKKAGWDKDFGCAGTVEEWSRLVNLLYAREGAEPYQFAIGCAFAAPLIEITEASNWHGIPVALTGTTGLGKTTTCKVAASIYGHCSNFVIASGKDGATMNAMVSRIGTARNLPVIFDELTDRDTDEVSSFLYSLSSGKPKDRNRADGTIIDLGLSWNTITFLTSNKNVTELLFLLDEQAVTEATQIRVFEIALRQEDIGIWEDTNAVDLIEHQLLEANYGHAGRVWLRYVMENRGKLKDEIRKLRTKYTPNSAEDTRERYYRDLIAAVVVALKHAIRLKLVGFDIFGVAKWARANILGLRIRRNAQSFTPEEYIAHFLHSLNGRMIVTKQLRDGRSTVETPLELVRGEPAARMAIDDKIFLVLRKAITDWCQERRVQASWLIEEMDKRELIRYTHGAQTRKERIGRGTNIPSAPSVCYELVYDKVVGLGLAEPTKDADKSADLPSP
jgi:energy-coupling factor transporter ATP-binding protein EcfA2